MSIKKFRSVTEMTAPQASNTGNLVARIRDLWERAFLFCPPSWPMGVKRFANHTEANEDRLRMTVLRMRNTRGTSEASTHKG